VAFAVLKNFFSAVIVGTNADVTAFVLENFLRLVSAGVRAEVAANALL